MASFRAGHSAVLVATHVAARGIDVAEVGLVVNFELPQTAEWLTHRVRAHGAKRDPGTGPLRLLCAGRSREVDQAPQAGRAGPCSRRRSGLLDSGEWLYQPHDNRPAIRPSGPRTQIVRGDRYRPAGGTVMIRPRLGRDSFRARRPRRRGATDESGSESNQSRPRREEGREACRSQPARTAGAPRTARREPLRIRVERTPLSHSSSQSVRR